MLILWLRTGKGYSWDGVSVTVDTGTAGDADQKAAEAKGKAEEKKKGFGKGKATSLLKVYVQELLRTIKRICRDQDMDTPEKLHAWMTERKDQYKALGLEIPALPEKKEKKKKK